MFNRGAFENSTPDGISVIEILSATGTGEHHSFVPLRRTELRGEVAGPLATLRLTQSFLYTSHQSDKVVEAVYRFPLPGDAAVTAVRVRFGDVEIEAELKERESAEKSYEQAKKEGRQAGLLTRESPDVFTLQVAGIQPDQEVTVETAYVQLARAEGHGWSLRIPLTTAPRFVREDEVNSRHAQGQPLGLMLHPQHRFALDLHFAETGEVGSSTHQLRQESDGDGLRVRLREGETLPDRDCLLFWCPRQEKGRPSLSAIVGVGSSKDRYFLALVSPPAGSDPGVALPREVTLLVDHSGSMSGPKWEAADWAVKSFLLGLGERDSFALGLFHDTTRWFSDKPERADRATVDRALRFLNSHTDSGGTQLGIALEQALAMQHSQGEVARHLLVITDAEVSDEGRILQLAEEESEKEGRRRISVICIDAAPNSFLALQLARQGGGVARFLTSSPEEEDIATALDEILADWAAPILTALRLEANRPRMEAACHQSTGAGPGWSSVDLGDLPAGRPIWVSGRVQAGDNTPLTLRLVVGNREIARWEAPPEGTRETGHALPALFGAERLVGLEFLIGSHRQGRELARALARLGYDAEQFFRDLARRHPKLYVENAVSDARDALKGLLVKESLRYGIACSETAFVATRTEAGRKVDRTVRVANALPSGWSESFLSQGPALLAPPPMPYPAAPSVTPNPTIMEMRATAFMRQPQPFPAQSLASGIAGPLTGGGTMAVLFEGVPEFADGEAVLYDSDERGAALRGRELMVSRLRITTDGGSAQTKELTILIYMEDMDRPRARMRVADLLRQGGARPLNLRGAAGSRMRITLVDPAGEWKPANMKIEVELS